MTDGHGILGTCGKGAFWQPALVALLALIAYANSFPGQFIWDDNVIVLRNPVVEQFDTKRIFLADYWGAGLSDLYRPITILSLAINRWMLGEAALGYHLINVLLHAGVSVLVWRVLRTWAFPAAVAIFAGILFAVHPVHGEVVNVIVGRSELLAALFLLLGLASAHTRGLRAAVLAGTFFLLAILSKEHAIVFLPTIILLDLFRRGDKSFRELRWPLYGWLLFLAVGWFIWRTWGIPHALDSLPVHPDMAPLHFFSVADRILSAIQIQWIYLGKLILPIHLQGAYSGPGFLSAITFTWSLRGLLVLAGSALLLLSVRWGWRQNNPWALFASLYIIAFMPTSNIFFPIGTSFAERLAYLPSIWFCAGVATVAAYVCKWEAKTIHGWWSVCAYGVLLGILCLLRNQAFETPERYWRADIEHDQANVIAWFNLADVLAFENKQGEAETTFRKVLEMRPDFTPAWRLYAHFLFRNQRYGEALVAAKRAVADVNDIQARLIMAEVYLKLEDYKNSLMWLDQVAPLLDKGVHYWDVRGRILKGLGRHDEAVEAFYEVTIIPPGSDLPLELAFSLIYLQRFEEAEAVLNFALAENMGDKAKVLNTLGTVLAHQNRLTDAATAFEKAVQLSPANDYYRQNFDKVHAMFEKETSELPPPERQKGKGETK